MLGRRGTIGGFLLLVMLVLALPANACDLCAALSCEKTAFEDYWFPAIGNDPSLGLNWDQLNLTEAQRKNISDLDKQWKTEQARVDETGASPENKLQTLLRDSKSKTQEIMNTFKEIGALAGKSRENFELRYKVLTRDQQEKLQHLYKHRESLQARSRVFKDIAGQDMDAGMVLNSKARKRVLCPYAQMERTSAQKSGFMLL